MKWHMFSNPRRYVGLGVVAIAGVLAASSCAAASDLIEEQTGGTLNLENLEDIEIDGVEITENGITVDFDKIDLNAENFQIPDIVAPDFNIDIIEAPELPQLRFPEATQIELPEIVSPEISVAETPTETIYTVEGQVLFDFDQANLKPDALAKMDEILAAIQARGTAGGVEVAGHTDSVGTADYNHDLSVRRATGVALWFRERIPPEQDVKAIGYGEAQPIAKNTNDDGTDDALGQALNRRVEIIVAN